MLRFSNLVRSRRSRKVCAVLSGCSYTEESVNFSYRKVTVLALLTEEKLIIKFAADVDVVHFVKCLQICMSNRPHLKDRDVT